MKRHAPAADRNRESILEVLREVLPSTGVVLEIASGSGQHAAFFAGALPDLRWQPSDVAPAALESIEAYRVEANLENLMLPVRIDAEDETWPVQGVVAVLSINMIHIAPWTACLGLLKGASRLLSGGAPLVLYGPFVIDGDFIAPSNVAFDRRLRDENPEWGVRELRDVEHAASERGLELDRVVPRPANNQVVVFRKA